MITSLSWIPKGASKAMLDTAQPPSEEEIKELIHKSLRDMDVDVQNGEVAHAKAVAKSFGKPCSKSNAAAASSSSSAADADGVAKFLKELDMDNYDEEDDGIQLFSSGLGDLYYPSNELDPYLSKDTDANYDSEDLDDITIRPTDSLIVCASIKDKVNTLDIYVYEEAGDGTHNMYLHHDMIIPEVPLCTAWLDCPLKGGEKGNFVAIGSMDSSIEIWDLDIEDEVQPCVQVGRIAGETLDCHTDSVICLAWNKEFRNIVASASADKKVKVWDVATGKCKVTMEHHKKEVQAIAWNHCTPEVLLSGSRDRTVVLKDGRDPSHPGLKWSTKAKVESLAWDPHSEHSFVVSLKDGTVKGFDTRVSNLTPNFTLHAHDGEVSSISYNIHAPNLLATGSGDESVKLWDLSNNQPSWIATHNPSVGVVFSVSFSADCPFLLAVGGSEGKLNVWDTLSDIGVSRRYGSNRP